MAKKIEFENLIEKVDKIIEELEDGKNVKLSNYIEKYEEALKLITKAEEELEKTKGKVYKINKNSNKIEELNQEENNG